MKVYLDNNATTPIHPKIKEIISNSLEYYGNPSSHHRWGQESRYYIDQAREKIANFLGASSNEIIFTASGTEANNMVIKGIFDFESNDHLITTKIEHHSVLNTCKAIEKKGVNITYLDVDRYGIIDLDELRKAIRPNTRLVSIIYGNNEIGSIQPINEIAKITNKNNVLFHTDAVQAVGKIPINVKDLGIDFLTLSGHKIYAPKGVGALYICKGRKLLPLIEGGHHEKGRRAGTENILGIIALGEVCKILKNEMREEIIRIKKLRDKLEKEIFNNIPNVSLNGHPEKRLPGTLNITFSHIEGEAILLKLDMEGIAISTGSACSSDSLESSHVLTALGIDPLAAQGTIRFSIGRENTEQEIDYVIKTVPNVIESLRKLL